MIQIYFRSITWYYSIYKAYPDVAEAYTGDDETTGDGVISSTI